MSSTEPSGGKNSFCAPALAGTAVGAVTGLVVWALVSFVPAFRDGVPEPVTDVLPFALAWVGHTLTTWRAPHHPRPAATPTRTAPGRVLRAQPREVPGARKNAPPGTAGVTGPSVSGGAGTWADTRTRPHPQLRRPRDLS